MNIAIITGASSGMGKEFVVQGDKRYEFDEIWVIARRKERLEELAPLCKGKVVAICLDLLKDESFIELQEKLESEKPNVKLLVNASGFGKFGKFENADINQMANMCDLNFKALVKITGIVLPYIKEGGKIIEVGSLSSFEPVPHLSVYAATKAGVLSFTRSLRHELKNSKIKVLCLCPYWVKTEFFNAADEKEKIKKFDILYEADFVVREAYRAVDKGRKAYLTPGVYASFIRGLAKILPHKLMMAMMDKMFKYEKQEKDD